MPRFLIAVIAASLCCHPASPASATAPVAASPSAHVSVVDMPQRPTDSGRHTIILEAPDDAWGVRVVARDASERIGGLVIKTDRGITCDAQVSCIRVHVGRFDHSCGDLGRDWYACASIGTDPGVIWLDTRTSPLTRRNKACHELGHALGLRHHDLPGCVGAGFLELLSEHEVKALGAVFPDLRARG